MHSIKSVLVLALALTNAAGAATILVPTDQPTIADAIAAAAPGDVVHVEIGTYDERIEVPKGRDDITLEGDISGLTILEGTPGTNNNILRIRSNRVLVQDFTFIGGNIAVRLDHSTGSTLQFLTIQGPREGIRVTNGSGNTIEAVAIDGTTNGAGVKVSNSPGVTVGATVLNARRDGIRVQNSEGGAVFFSTVENARGGDGIRMSRVANGSASLNFVQGSYHDGIRIQNSPGIVVENNESDFNRNYGFRVERSAPIATATDLENAGNAGTDNGSGTFRVLP